MKRLQLPAALLLAALPAACSDGRAREYGDPVALDAAVRLSLLLEREDVAAGESVTVSGRIGEVCTSAGCWFVLEEVSGGKAYGIRADLKPAAGFTVPADLRGRQAVVVGRLVGVAPDRELHAVGLRVE